MYFLFKFTNSLLDNFTSCSTTIIMFCVSIATTFQSSMLNLNPFDFSSNYFFSFFASSAFANAYFSKSHKKACKSITLLMSDGKNSYGHKPCCFKLLTFKVGLMSIVNILSNHVNPSSPALKFDNSKLPFLNLPTSLL
jgi:low temperature requirement protein LtrA